MDARMIGTDSLMGRLDGRGRQDRWRLIGSGWLGAVCLALSSLAGAGAMAQVPARPVSDARNQPVAEPTADQRQLVDELHKLQHLMEALEPYRPQAELKGELTLIGSTTIFDLGQAWANQFRNFHPGVQLVGQQGPSAEALAALAKDPKVFAGISRTIDDSDRAAVAAEGKVQELASFIVALDPLAIMVHPENPLAALTPSQFQQLLLGVRAQDGQPLRWGDLGVTGPLAGQPVRYIERGAGSGIRVFLSRMVAAAGDMIKPVSRHDTCGEFLSAIASDRAAVGIGSMTVVDSQVKVLGLQIGDRVVRPDDASVLAGEYPLMRPLSVCFDKSQLSHDGGLRREVMRFILSHDGQSEVVKAGFYPLNPGYLLRGLAQLSDVQLR
jgi:phosphate transport system substrate-binding protein